jgi:hypothetical protein
MDKVQQLEQKLRELELRLGILENYIDRNPQLFFNHDQSAINALKIEVMNDMEAQGKTIANKQERLGQKFYRK